VKFKIESRRKEAFGVFFPEALAREWHIWGITNAQTSGLWTNYRLIMGDFMGVLNRVYQVAREFNAYRKRKPEIDIMRLLEDVPQIRATGLEYYDYSGRIETISRESVLVQFASGRRVALQRDQGYGFRGIIVRTDEPWSMETWAINEINRIRNFYLSTGQALPHFPIQEPWALRHGLELQINRYLNQAWTEYVAEPTMEKLNEVIAVDGVLRDYLAESLRWLHRLFFWEHQIPLPFPNSAAAVELWMKGIMNNLIYDETEPWYLPVEQPRTKTVTAIRRAYLTTQRVNITITTNPRLSVARHQAVPTFHDLITYGPPPYTGVGVPNPDHSQQAFTPFVGAQVGNAFQQAWPGFLPIRAPWRSLQEDGPVPEPTLEVRSRLMRVGKHLAENLEAAVGADKPVLMYVPINGATAPVLVLPRLFMETKIVPLFGSARVLKPTMEHANISGWVTERGDNIANRFMTPPDGFEPRLSEHRPIRDGALNEIIPYA
jgi:hypothetical protein